MQFVAVVDFVDADTDPIAYRIEAADADEAYAKIEARHPDFLDITFADEVADEASIANFWM